MLGLLKALLPYHGSLSISLRIASSIGEVRLSPASMYDCDTVTFILHFSVFSNLNYYHVEHSRSSHFRSRQDVYAARGHLH